MPVVPHFAARQQFLTVLDNLLSTACERWQRRELKWRPADELPPGVPAAPLMVARFLREECEDASYKFWKGIRDGAEDSDAPALLTRRVFDQFLVRLRRCQYFKADEVEELKRYFDRHYWPVESAWLDGRRTRLERGKLFAELGGVEAVNAIPRDVQTFHAWSRGVIGDAYSRNDYQLARQIGDAVVQEAATHVARTFADDDLVLGLCAVQEAACAATMVNLNCWAPEPGDLLLRLDEIAQARVTNQMLAGRQRHDLGRFATIATMLKAVCRRFERPEDTEPSLVRIYRMLGYLRFHQDIRAQVADVSGASVDSATITLMLSEAVSLRADWLRAFGLFRRLLDVPGYEAMAKQQLTVALGDELEAGLVDGTLAFMAAPHRLVEDEWSATQNGTASAAGFNDVALAILGARVWLQPDVVNLNDSLAWLNRAKDQLAGCNVQLAWSDFYCACDAYMQERGHPTLCDYALNSVRKLQRRAGNARAEQHFETEVLEVASRRKRAPIDGESPDDIDLQWFLREEPPPLSSGA